MAEAMDTCASMAGRGIPLSSITLLKTMAPGHLPEQLQRVPLPVTVVHTTCIGRKESTNLPLTALKHSISTGACGLRNGQVEQSLLPTTLPRGGVKDGISAAAGLTR